MRKILVVFLLIIFAVAPMGRAENGIMKDSAAEGGGVDGNNTIPMPFLQLQCEDEAIHYMYRLSSGPQLRLIRMECEVADSDTHSLLEDGVFLISHPTREGLQSAIAIIGALYQQHRR